MDESVPCGRAQRLAGAGRGTARLAEDCRGALALAVGARHSQRVSGAVFKVSDFEGVFKVSDFAPSKMRSVRFRVVCKVSGCEMSSFRNFEPSKNFEPSVRIFEPSENFETSARKCRPNARAAGRIMNFWN